MNALERQAACYRAQAALDGYGQRWAGIRGARAYVRALSEDQEAVEAVGADVLAEAVVIRWRSNAWAGTACGKTKTIRLVALEEAVLLHELVHLSLPAGTGHSPEFARRFLEVVRLRMGFVAYAEFGRALAAEGVL